MKVLKAKHIIIFILIGCLYFSGIAAIIYPMVSNLYSLTTSKTVITDYQDTVEQMPDRQIEDKLQRAAEYNKKLSSGTYDHDLEKCLCDSDGLMCYVEIPSLGIYLPVYYGTDGEVLQKGCGCLKNTSLPVGGSSVHSVISGHTGLPTAEMFTKLDQMKENDIFYIHVLDRVLAYKVVMTEAVSPNKTELLEIVKNKDYCTLLTCTPYGINDKRLLVRGERTAYIPAEAASVSSPAPAVKDTSADSGLEQEITHQLTVIGGIVISSVIIYIFGLIWLLHSIGKKPSQPSADVEENDVKAQ